MCDTQWCAQNWCGGAPKTTVSLLLNSGCRIYAGLAQRQSGALVQRRSRFRDSHPAPEGDNAGRPGAYLNRGFDSATEGFDSLWCWGNRIRRLYICRMMYAGAYHRLESGWQGNLLGSTPTFGAIPVWVSLPYSQRVEEPPRVPRKTSIVSACVAHDPSSEPFSFCRR